MPEEILTSELASTEAEIWVDIPGFDNFQVSNLRWTTAKENSENRGGIYGK